MDRPVEPKIQLAPEHPLTPEHPQSAKSIASSSDCAVQSVLPVSIQAITNVDSIQPNYRICQLFGYIHQKLSPGEVTYMLCGNSAVITHFSPMRLAWIANDFAFILFLGVDRCSDKLMCQDGRCLSHNRCCRERDLAPPNCSIMATIQCCRQLVHPSVLDQDLYYLEARRHHQQWKPQTDSTLIMGCIVAIANIVTVGIIVGVRYHLWRSSGSTSRAHYHLTRLRSATLRPFGLGSSVPPPSNTDQYQLRSADNLYTRRIPGLRSDLLSPEIVREQRHHSSHSPHQFSGGVVLCPPTASQPPHYSQLPSNPTGPPPAYHQVVGAPPPPYSSRDDLAAGCSNDGSSLSLLSPLLSNGNNNNGDINGNSTSHVSVLYDRNLVHAAASSSTSPHCSVSQNRMNK
ncbi:uncharacterized protein LOC135202778 [Macrobrachium nipponense]|uniref:uncharacterized protein LOC135202778 n=1 Tax=Macrobrachium nipponense TaxID=159736 RepID=UPI0030C89B0E